MAFFQTLNHIVLCYCTTRVGLVYLGPTIGDDDESPSSSYTKQVHVPIDCSVNSAGPNGLWLCLGSILMGPQEDAGDHPITLVLYHIVPQLYCHRVSK